MKGTLRRIASGIGLRLLVYDRYKKTTLIAPIPESIRILTMAIRRVRFLEVLFFEGPEILELIIRSCVFTICSI